MVIWENIEQVWEDVKESLEMDKLVREYRDSRNNLIKEFNVPATTSTNVVDKTHLFWRTATTIYTETDEFSVDVYTAPDLETLEAPPYDEWGVVDNEDYAEAFLLNPQHEKFEDYDGFMALQVDLNPAEIWVMSKSLRQPSLPDEVHP